MSYFSKLRSDSNVRHGHADRLHRSVGGQSTSDPGSPGAPSTAPTGWGSSIAFGRQDISPNENFDPPIDPPDPDPAPAPDADPGPSDGEGTDGGGGDAGAGGDGGGGGGGGGDGGSALRRGGVARS